MRDKAKRRPLLRGAVALAAAAAAALALALAAQGASAATVTVPDSFNGPPASQQLKLSKSNAKWEWKGVAGDAVEACTSTGSTSRTSTPGTGAAPM